MEWSGNYWKLLVSYRSWAWLAPTLTHITTRDPVISGAEDRAMSIDPQVPLSEILTVHSNGKDS